MSSRDGDLRWAAARIAARLARGSDEALHRLLALVANADTPALRRMAIFCLRDVPPQDPAAVRELVLATRASEKSVRRAALTALGACRGAPAEVSRRLIETIRSDPDAASRRIAALALGTAAKSAPAALRDTAESELNRIREDAADPDLQRAATLALRRMGESGS